MRENGASDWWEQKEKIDGDGLLFGGYLIYYLYCGPL